MPGMPGAGSVGPSDYQEERDKGMTGGVVPPSPPPPNRRTSGTVESRRPHARRADEVRIRNYFAVITSNFFASNRAGDSRNGLAVSVSVALRIYLFFICVTVCVLP